MVADIAYIVCNYKGEETLMSRNPIIIPARYDISIEILLDTHTGNTEMRVKPGPHATIRTSRISLPQLPGILSEHVTSLIKQSLLNNAGNHDTDNGENKPSV